MEFLFFSLLLFQLLVALIIIKEIMHPIIILKAYSSLCAFVLIIVSNEWGISIKFGTVFIYFTALLWIDLGYFIATFYFKGKKNNLEINKNKLIQDIQYSTTTALIFFTYIIVCLISLITFRKDFIVFGSGFENLSQSIILAKSAQRVGDIESLGILQYAITSCTVIGIIYVYIMIYELIKNGYSRKVLIFGLPVLATFILFYFTGRRAFLLNIFLTVLYLYYAFIYRKKGGIPLKFQLKIGFLAISFSAIFYIFFIVLGTLFDKAGDNPGFNTVAVYMSGGIAAFDNVYQYYQYSSDIFGQNIFRLIYKLLNIIPGASFPTETINQSVSIGNGIVTNVYTANLNYWADFGYAGVAFANIIIGAVYGYMYQKGKREIEIGFWNVLLAYFLINLIAYPGSEKFFVSMTVNIQYVIFFIFIFKSKILYKRGVVTKY